MLAPTEGVPDEFIAEGKLKLPKFFSPKLDGIRAVYHRAGLLSRSMKPIQNHYINNVINEVAAKVNEKIPGGFTGMDGELIVGDETAPDVYLTTSSQVMSRDGEPDFKLRVFDRYYQSTGCRDPLQNYTERLEYAKRIVDAADSPFVSMVEHVLGHSVEYMQEFEDWALDRGYEGIMMNDPYAVYKCGRGTMISQVLLKRKAFVDFEALILDTYEQMENTNEAVTDERGRSKRSSHQDGLVPKGTLGGFTVRAVDGIIFNVGSGPGLTAQLRQELWNRRDILPGNLLKIRKQKVGEKDKPRQPKFLGFRSPDDLSPVNKHQQAKKGYKPELDITTLFG